MVPTITTLLKLAVALERPIGHFVDDGVPAPVAGVVAADAGADVPTGDPAVTRTAITAAPDRFRISGTVTVVEPGGSGDAGEPHAGEELVHVLEGALEFDVAGERHTAHRGRHAPVPRRPARSVAQSGRGAGARGLARHSAGS